MTRMFGVGVGRTGGRQAVSWAVEEAVTADARPMIHHVLPSGSHPTASSGARSTAGCEPADPASSAAVAVARTRPGDSRAFAGHVVIGVNGSPAGRDAVAFGFGYAAAHGLPVAVAHVSCRTANDYFYDDTTLSTYFTAEPAELELLAVEVEPWERRYPHIAVRRAVLVGGRLPGLIRAGAQSRLLVVGRRHRRPGVAAPGGGLISRLVRHAPGAIAVVPEGFIDRTTAGPMAGTHRSTGAAAVT